MKRSTKDPHAPSVLSSLRQLLNSRRPRFRIAVPRRRPPGGSATAPEPAAVTVSHPHQPQLRPAVTEPSPTPVTASAAVSLVPAPPRDPNADDSDASSASDGSVDEHDESSTKKKKKKKKKRTNSTWVAKLLNQTGAPPPHRDRVFASKLKRRRHRDAARGETTPSTTCHAMLRVAQSPFHATLVARVFAFLAPIEPARSCALVNRVLAAYVSQYYARLCDWPRPRAFLAHQLLSLRHAETTGVLSRALAMLPLVDRVRASATSLAFRCAADALPLELLHGDHTTQFLRRLSPSRIELRYQQTTALCCDAVAPRDAVRLLQLMSGDDDDGDHFGSVRDIAVRGLPGFDSEAQFVALVQALFSDRISQSLRSLVLAQLRLEDAHFRHLARLFYDGRFPRLDVLDVSGNLFPSRFMRDWARSFHEDRFAGLVRLNVTGVGMGVEDMGRFIACLRHVPKLVELRISHNFCSVGNIQDLATVLTERYLGALEVLSCSAVSVSDHGLHVLVEALCSPGCCAALRSLDLSGNDLSGGDQTMRSLTDAFMSGAWPDLQYLNLSFTKPTNRGFQFLTRGLAQKRMVRLALRELHLAGNGLEGDAFESLIVAMHKGSFRSVQLLNLSDNLLGVLEFELLADCLSAGACPLLQTLVLSANKAKGDGITRFRRFFRSRVAQTLHTLDLSGNAIPAHSLDFIAEELMKSDCRQLQVLNVSRNMAPRSVVRFQQLIRSNKCPSLACVQVGYAQSEAQGYEFVRTVRSKISVDELRRLKQLQFEARMKRIEEENVAKAAHAAARCKRQTKLLREMYDHLESQADRALRRRKRVRKSPHLLIHEEIQQLKQNKYHEKVCRDLERALRGTAQSA